jgi:hypothetical protein
MGKALFGGQLVAGHLVQYLPAHAVVGHAYSDLEMVDEEYLQQLESNSKQCTRLDKISRRFV